MIEYDTTKVPQSHLGRQSLLDAIYRAPDADENEWVSSKPETHPPMPGTQIYEKHVA